MLIAKVKRRREDVVAVTMIGDGGEDDGGVDGGELDENARDNEGGARGPGA